ncbi:MAG TPA: cation:proton antiporter [Pseudonocardiaceae bacterium]|jgi:Kef-type K+ transport system membrane component KefB|nr:cation:proton antiporter [Pseudonocardiaceae bacterium]
MGSNAALPGELLLALLVILVATTALGWLCGRIGQPRVVGEMIGGILLGPSVLGAVAPSAERVLFSADVKSALNVLSTIGLTVFMFLIGAGVDHGLVTTLTVRRSLAVAIAGIVPAFALGALTAVLFARRVSPSHTPTLVFVLFLAGAMSLTAFPVLARILQERRMTTTRLGTLAMLAASVDDVFAWSLLAIIIALAGASGLLSASFTIAVAAVFALVMLTVVRRMLEPLARRVEERGRLGHGEVAVLVILVIASGWFTNAIGIHSIFGGFIAGMAIPRSPVLRAELRRRLADLAVVLLLPVFFAYSGLNTSFAGFSGHGGLLLPLAVTVVLAFAGKFIGCTLTMRGLGFSWRHSSAVGGLMNARGLMILIFIDVGLQHHIIGAPMFSILTIVAVITTASATPIYRMALPTPMEDAEREGAEDAEPAPPEPATTPAHEQPSWQT